MNGAVAVETGGEDEDRDLIAFARAAADDLELFAALHDREPTAAVIDALREGPIEDQLGLVLRSEGGKASLDAFAIVARELPSSADNAAMDALAAGYADVYLRHTFRAAPSESVWLTEDGLEQQAPMFAVREAYRRHNLKADDWANRPDDHLVLQLRFLAHLFANAQTTADLEAPARFLDEHLLRWLKPFAIRLVDAGAPDFFAALAVLTASYVDELRDHLLAITGLARPRPAPLVADTKASEEERPYVPGVAPTW